MRSVLDKFMDKYLGGNISLGPVTIYGRNAMHWAVHIYCSYNTTPSKSHFKLGGE